MAVGKRRPGGGLGEDSIGRAGLEHRAAQLPRGLGVGIADQHDLHGGLQRLVAVE